MSTRLAVVAVISAMAIIPLSSHAEIPELSDLALHGDGVEIRFGDLQSVERRSGTDFENSVDFVMRGDVIFDDAYVRGYNSMFTIKDMDAGLAIFAVANTNTVYPYDYTATVYYQGQKTVAILDLKDEPVVEKTAETKDDPEYVPELEIVLSSDLRVYWKENFDFEVIVFDTNKSPSTVNKNVFNGRIDNVNVTVALAVDGKTVETYNGTTVNGVFEGKHYFVENLSTPGKYKVDVTASVGNASATHEGEFFLFGQVQTSSNRYHPILGNPALDEGTGILNVTFNDAATINATQFHIRESGEDEGGVTFSDADLNQNIFKLNEANRQKVIAMTVPTLDVDQNAVYNTAGVRSVEVIDLQLNVTADMIPPGILGAPTLNEGTGVLYITFNETIDDSKVDATKFHIRENGSNSDGVTLSGGERDTTVKGTTLQFNLTESNRQTVIALTTPTLDVDGDAVYDTSDNGIASDLLALNATEDTIPPTIKDTPTLNEDTGVLVITFDETVNVSGIDESGFHIRESGETTGGITLSDGELTTREDGPTIRFTLEEDNRLQAIALNTPTLHIDAGAVSDVSDRGIKLVSIHIQS